MTRKYNNLVRAAALCALIFTASDAFAQSSDSSSLLIYTLVVVGVIVLLGVIMHVSDNLIQIEAQKRNVQQTGIGLFPRLTGLFSRSLPDHLRDKEVHILKRGYDIKLEGEANEMAGQPPLVTRYALQPPNWRGIRPIPKLHVQEGDNVKAGQPVFFDKANPEIEYVAPVSGEVIEVVRGEKRSIAEIVILADKEQQFVQHDAPDVATAPREELVAYLQKTGGWSLLRQRPFDIVPDTDVEPANIFISTFDTAPLAPDLSLVIQGKEEAFQKGLDVLGRLTHGKVHLGIDGRKDADPSPAFTNASGVQKHYFVGPHPAGNVGVQIHHIAPITPSKKVWVANVQDVATIGELFISGRFDASRVIALTGEPLQSPQYVRTYLGANIGELLKGNLDKDHVRLISGDVLSGERKQQTGYVNAFDDQVSVIEEGDHYEMFGWLIPQKARPSVSGTYPNGLFPDLKYVADTNTHGERRAFVVTGQYEKVLPMDIYPQHLMKAIMTKDFEKMEGLGIHELSEEDVALCEFACTSKQPLQSILREGLEMMREQG